MYGEWMDGRTDGWTTKDGQMDGGRADGWDGQTDGLGRGRRTDGRTD